MNFILLIARNQFLLAWRTLSGWQFLYLAYLAALFGVGCFLIPFSYLFIFASVAPVIILSTLSIYRLRSSYEIDAGVLSIYPLSQQKKFGLLFLIDMLHLNGLLFVVSFILVFTTGLIHFTVAQALLLALTLTAYWFFFTALNLAMRTFCRRNFTYYYFFRITSSLIIFAFFILSRRNDKAFIESVTNFNPLHFVLCSIAVLALLYFAVNKWFDFYLHRHPFANPDLAQKFVTRRWR